MLSEFTGTVVLPGYWCIWLRSVSTKFSDEYCISWGLTDLIFETFLELVIQIWVDVSLEY